MDLSPDLAREPAHITLMSDGPSNHTHRLPGPRHSTRVSSCLHALPRLSLLPGRAPRSTVQKAQLQSPSHYSLPRQPPLTLSPP